jgi:hypothetical protein
MRMRVEYIEMPDLMLTRLQARRLWNLSQELCDMALAALVHTGFLWETHDGIFLRRGLGRTAGFRARPEAADAAKTIDAFTKDRSVGPATHADVSLTPRPASSEPGTESAASADRTSLVK